MFFRTLVPAVALSLGLFQATDAFAAPSSASAQRRLASLQRLGIVNAGVSLKRTQVLKPAGSGVSAKARTAAATAVQFEFTRSTFPSDAVYNDLVNFRRTVTPFIDAVYGDAAPLQQGATVEVRGDGDVSGFQPRLNHAGGGTIFFLYDSSASANVNHYNFVRTLLAAYHGPTVMTLDYGEAKTLDPWETAFQDAAALQVMYQYLGKPSDFDPADLTPYVFPFYDFMNSPELGNAYFGTELGIATFRAAMSQAAWLKVYAEDSSFFSKFNAAYYAAWTGDLSIAGDTARLKAIAAGVTPTVEGLNFNDWYRQQYALDTAVTTGEKLYLGILPVPSSSGDGNRSGFDAIAEHLTTNPDGSETELTGSGVITATDETGADLTSFSAELKNSRIVGFADDSFEFPGEAIFHVGFAGLGSPDRARVNIKIATGATEAKGYFPYGVAGSTSSASSFFGATVGANSGTLGIAIQGGNSQSTNVQRGVWTSTLAYPSGPSVKTTFTFSGRTVKRNSAWLVPGNDDRSFAFLLEVPPGNTTFTYTVPSGASDLRMISIPLFPNATDEADILGVPKDQLKLARYRANLSSKPVGEGSLPFGIDGDRHELYPNISTPMEPGRGYWLGNQAGLNLSIKGGQPSQSTPYEVPLSGGWAASGPNWTATGGWNQIGVPFNREFTSEGVRVRYGGFAPVPWSTAVTRGWVGAGIWRWKPAGGYERIDGISTTLKPFEGYYVYSRQPRGVVLVFDVANASAQAVSGKGWDLKLTAATTKNRDASNAIGVSAERIPAAKPPTGGKVVTLRFLTSGSSDDDASGAGTATGWADSFLPSLGNSGQWNFLVDGTESGARVTLSWGDFSRVPADLRLRLIDTVNSKATRLRAGTSYSFTSKGTPRKFRIEAKRLPRPAIAVTKVPSNQYKVTVTANMTFTGRVEIKRDGQTYRVLRNGEFPKGTSTFTWDRRDTTGKAVASGTYHAWIIPDDADGTATQVPFAVQ